MGRRSHRYLRCFGRRLTVRRKKMRSGGSRREGEVDERIRRRRPPDAFWSFPSFSSGKLRIGKVSQKILKKNVNEKNTSAEIDSFLFP